MGEDDIRNYLNSQGASKPLKREKVPPRRVVRRPRSVPPQQDAYKDFSATHLMCPKCKQAMPVRERLMLILPTGNLYDYVCTVCGTSAGTRKG